MKNFTKTTQELWSEDGNVKKLHGQMIQIEKGLRKQEQQILKNHHRSAESWVDMNLEEREVEIEETLNKIKEDLLAQQKIIADLGRHQQNLQKQQDILKTHLTSFKNVGEIPVSYKEQIKVEPGQLIDQWIKQNKVLSARKDDYHKGFKERLKDLSYRYSG